MKQKISIAFVLLALLAGFVAMTAKAKGGAVGPTQTAQPTPTATLCEVTTGFENGAVNLRTCGATACEVIRILTEGESLKVIRAGAWANVATSDGATGYINSNYCK